MKVAWVTPLTPLQSGISDFSEEVLGELKKHMEIDIFIGDYKPINKDIIDNFNIRAIKELEQEDVRNQYDEIVYQMGNNSKYHEDIYRMALKYPGIVELHDVAIHHFIAEITFARGKKEEYKEIMEYCHGKGAAQVVDDFFAGRISAPWETDSIIFTLNKKLIDNAKGIIVHSDFAKQMVKGVNPNIPVIVIYHHSADIYPDYKERKVTARKELGIAEDEFVIASFGFASKTKRIIETMKALAEVKKQGYKFKYIVAGKAESHLNIDEVAEQLGIVENLEVTGFLELENMKKIMLATDLCVSLRYPTQGETSGVLHRMFGMGKMIMVTNIANFSEYPNDAVIKIDIENEIEQITNYVIDIYNKKINQDKYEYKSWEFADKECNLEKNAKVYKSFISKIAEYHETNMEDILIDVFSELGIIDNSLISNIVECL